MASIRGEIGYMGLGDNSDLSRTLNIDHFKDALDLRRLCLLGAALDTRGSRDALLHLHRGAGANRRAFEAGGHQRGRRSTLGPASSAAIVEVLTSLPRH